MQTPPEFTPVQTADEPTPQGPALGARPPAAGKVAPTRRVRGGTVAKKEHAALVEDRKASRMGPDGRPLAHRPKTTARDALVAVQYNELSKAAPAIIKRLIEGALDKGDPYHERCLDIVAKRVMPLEFWNSLGKQEFKEEGDGANRPVFVVNIGTAAVPDAPVVEVVPRERGDEE